MKPRRTYTPIRIDFTPFVSVALLLIVFFVWVKMVHKSSILRIWEQKESQKGVESERRKQVLEILLVDKDIVQFCYFSAGSVCRANFVETDRHSIKLRETLLRHRKEALIPGMLDIIIRPSRESTFGSLAYVLDELRIAGDFPYQVAY